MDKSASITPPELVVDTIYEGNSLKLIRSVATDSVHLILSDIPYGIGMDDWDVLHTNTNSAYLGFKPGTAECGCCFQKTR